MLRKDTATFAAMPLALVGTALVLYSDGIASVLGVREFPSVEIVIPAVASAMLTFVLMYFSSLLVRITFLVLGIAPVLMSGGIDWLLAPGVAIAMAAAVSIILRLLVDPTKESIGE